MLSKLARFDLVLFVALTGSAASAVGVMHWLYMHTLAGI